MTNLDRLIDSHLAGYCEPDSVRRAALLSDVWEAHGILLDPPLTGTGPDEIAALVDVVLQHYPGHRFVRTSGIDAHHDHARYTWALTAPDGTASVIGTDVATIVDGRLSRIIGFFGDLAPAAG
jgi:hypothetical protein